MGDRRGAAAELRPAPTGACRGRRRRRLRPHHPHRAAGWLGCESHVYVSAGASPERLDLLREEGAVVVEVEGSYDDALAAAAAGARHDDVILSEKSSGRASTTCPAGSPTGTPPGLRGGRGRARGGGESPAPDTVVVPLGTGALAAAATWFRTERFPEELRLVGVEPSDAACFRESALAGERRSLPAPRSRGARRAGAGAPLADGPRAGRGGVRRLRGHRRRRRPRGRRSARCPRGGGDAGRGGRVRGCARRRP
ncbi:MAG: pyridoxal-phosphate dependent enzyme [Acidimicrobiia bacterium]|nr:pyridoxal-phosphate dependent enzyme [Acidimicrobiia bacterium]